jgi:uncharacterized protein (TIGR00725 family)
MRRPLIGVMGCGEGASAASIRMAEELGAAIAGRGWALLTGGRPEGVMAAACRGAGTVEAHLVVGVLPGDGRGHGRQQTAELDLALFTGMGQALNLINVLSADVVVVCGAGGSGHGLGGGSCHQGRAAAGAAGGAAAVAGVLLVPQPRRAQHGGRGGLLRVD